MKRRDFLKLGALGLAGVAVDGVTGFPGIFGPRKALAADQTLALTLREVMAEMVTLEQVYMWAFEEPTLGPHIPGPVIFATEGDSLTVEVTNAMDEDHAFAVPGVVASGVIAPGQTASVAFTAPAPGTYFYLDPLNAPVNRVLGLHGVLVVLPATGNTPYGLPTARVQALFDDLGTTARFPGNPWDPARTWIWVFNTVDPAKNQAVFALAAGQTIDPAVFAAGYLPRFFTLNGRSGYFSAHDPDIAPSGRVGEPALVRVLNAGMVTHSPHIHGNHVFQVADNNVVRDNVFYVDTWSMRPGDVKDVLHPFIRPPDIPAGAWPPAEEGFPLRYPMHCHTEMSQTAGGGNYPQGLVTDWDLLGDLA